MYVTHIFLIRDMLSRFEKYKLHAILYEGAFNCNKCGWFVATIYLHKEFIKSNGQEGILISFLLS